MTNSGKIGSGTYHHLVNPSTMYYYNVEGLSPRIHWGLALETVHPPSFFHRISQAIPPYLSHNLCPQIMHLGKLDANVTNRGCRFSAKSNISIPNQNTCQNFESLKSIETAISQCFSHKITTKFNWFQCYNGH